MKTINICFVILIQFLFILNVSAVSMSEIDIVVRETVIAAQPTNPKSNEPLKFSEIGYLQFSSNFLPNQCIALVSGLILESEDYKSIPVMSFLVCVSKELSGELRGRVIEIYVQ